ncbi:MAG: RNA polymerase sigma factor [Polyangiaceae bacterium]|nr:RNA polymerase sigma factor [Polyangiaceae bacterium]
MTARMQSTEPSEELRRRPTHLRLVRGPNTASNADDAPVDTPADAPRNAPISEADQWWLEALRRGDSNALTRLYREHHQPVRALVRRLLAQTSDVEDVVHDVFVAAPAAFRGYRGEGSVRSYLFTMAVNHVRHHVRSTTRRRSWLERFRLVPTLDKPPIQPDTQNERRQLAERLASALDKLSFDHRTVVVLCEVEELTSVEAAQVLGVPEGTVRTRLHHAKKKLRSYLEGDHRE